jgi:hypothetical protein
MAEILYAPNREQVVTSNAWAFLHWLRTTRGVDLPDWAALQVWSNGNRGAFGLAIAKFVRLPDAPLRLARHTGHQEALITRGANGSRLVFDRDQLRRMHPGPRPPTPPPKGRGSAEPTPPLLVGRGWGEGVAKTSPLPVALTAPLTRLWPPALLIRPLADLLLHADIRPDDRLLVVGSATWPWLAALLEGTTVILAAATPATLLATAADEAATVLVAPAQTLAEAAFQRARHRPNLARLRTIIATGGPLSPEGRTRIYTWIKSDLMLLGRTGDTFWGNPLEPVLARPVATPGFFTPPASDPAIP